MVQHVNDTLYINQRVVDSVLWVVAAFVILGGYNTMLSWERKGNIDVTRKLLKILIPYVICTCIYMVWENRFFSVEAVLQKVIHFNAAGPLYFVAVYVQLVIVSPFLIGCINWAEEKRKFVRQISILIMILLISHLSTHYTDIFGIIIGGGNLFSGFWLIFWYIGMLFAAEKREIKVGQKKIISFVLLILCLLWEYIFVFKNLNDIFREKYGNMFHMTVQLTWWNALEAFLIILFFKEVIELIETKEIKTVTVCLKLVSYIGKNSFCIFMYHILFRDICYTYFPVGNIWIRRIICFGFMIGGSIMINYFLRRLKQIANGILNRANFY